MNDRIRRSFDEPDRDGLSYSEIWHGPDKSLIKCWEVGRQLGKKDPELARRAWNGELVALPWKGGTANLEELAVGKKATPRYGTLQYLAMWQGLRGEELEVSLIGQTRFKCTRTKREVIFDLETAANLDP